MLDVDWWVCPNCGGQVAMSAIAFALLDDNEVVDSARAAGLQGTVDCPFCRARARLEKLCK